MPRIVATHTVNDVKHWASKGDERVEIIGPFATELVSYVAADGSNQVAVSANIHDMLGLCWVSPRPTQPTTGVATREPQDVGPLPILKSKRGRRYASVVSMTYGRPRTSQSAAIAYRLQPLSYKP